MSFARTIEDALVKISRTFSGGGELSGVLKRSAVTGGVDDVPVESETDYPFRGAVWGRVSLEERTLGLVEDTDRVLLVGASTIATAPKDGDIVEIGGEALRIKTARSTQPAGEPLLHRLILQR